MPTYGKNATYDKMPTYGKNVGSRSGNLINNIKAEVF